jgi:prolipoprotein diacylglyceryltransferase
VLLLGLWLARGRLRQPGARFLVAALGYAVIRVGLSFMRQEAIVAWGLQEAQLIALAAGLVALGLLLTRTRTHRAVPSQVR